MDSNRLSQQLQFIIELDKLKAIIRRTQLIHVDRHENSAEHSWHLAMLAIVLSEHANEQIDLLRVLKMLLIHDIVEIDAGDTYCYDEEGARDKADRELQAAQRLFGMLPEDQARELHALWEDFEEQSSAEARFATALDRLMPLLHNYHTHGQSWQEHGITSQQVNERNAPIRAGAEPLWEIASSLIQDAVARGLLAAAPEPHQA